MTNSADVIQSWTAQELDQSNSPLLNINHACDFVAVERILPDPFVINNADELEVFRDSSRKELGDVARQIGERVMRGPGLCILRGDGLAAWSDGKLAALSCGLALQMGTLVVQNTKGQQVVEVRDRHPADPINSRGYVSNSKMMMHTDPSDIACLLCLEQGSEGGTSLFASSYKIHDVISNECPELVAEYYRLWDWYMVGLDADRHSKTAQSPVFSTYKGNLSCRYVSYMIRKGAEELGYPLSPRQVAAIDKFDEVAHREDLTYRRKLSRGESVWMNNYTVLHGREQFQDDAKSDKARRLLRYWVNHSESPEKSGSFMTFEKRLFEHTESAASSGFVRIEF